MKATFKPLGLATAVATATAGYAGVASANSKQIAHWVTWETWPLCLTTPCRTAG